MVRLGSGVRVPFRACSSGGPSEHRANMCSVSVTVHKAFRYQLRPTRRQESLLLRAAGARRFAYNWALERWLVEYRETGSTIRMARLMRELTTLKRRREYAWMREVDSQLLQQAILDVRSAFRAFFERRSGFPRFRSRKTSRQTFRIPQRVRIEGNRVVVPKIGRVRLHLSRPVRGVTKSATFTRDGTGRWWVSLVAEVEVPEPVAGSPIRPVGIDLGVVDLAMLSTGERVPRPRPDDGLARRLRRARRAMSRKRPQSRNRTRARRTVARLERRVANRRRDFLHKLTTRLVAEHDVIFLEDLGLQGLARTKLSRALFDASLGEFRRQCEYKALWRGTRCVAVDRFFPSSRTCATCGAVNASLAPKERVWRCRCGTVHDRDLNAARNLLTEGLRQLVAVGHTDTENARGARVSLHTGAASAEARIAG
jgi:putative transposase